MRILFVAALHHPAQLQAAIQQTPPGQPPPLFAPTVSQHFWERALHRRGCEMAIFYRNIPASGRVSEHHHQEGITPGKLIAGALNRVPPTFNPEYRRRNRRLIEQALDFQPDVLWLVGDNTVIYPDTLKHIKQATGCQIIYASGTSPIVFS
ncbi:MAG: hypothetical protein K8J31_09285, partial [Anaerolineae bacterium]|nr:hypothetical protein [Anaerolineae bacterium]